MRHGREWMCWNGGIPIETVRVPNRAGTKKIGAYRFGDPDNVERHKTGGRQPFSKAFKKLLYERQGGKCAFSGEPLEARYLSIGHRIPYQVAGDQVAAEDRPGAFMLIALGLQRMKSWSCENCRNGKEIRDITICDACYWANPENDQHIAMEQRRRIDITWVGPEITAYDILAKAAARGGISLPQYVKELLKRKA